MVFAPSRQPMILPVIKLLPPLGGAADAEWIETACEQVVRETESLGESGTWGQAFGHTMRARFEAA